MRLSAADLVCIPASGDIASTSTGALSLDPAEDSEETSVPRLFVPILPPNSGYATVCHTLKQMFNAEYMEI